MTNNEIRQGYEEYARFCGYALNGIRAGVENLEHHLEFATGRNLIHSITSRVKTFDSAVEKFKRKKYKSAEGKTLPLTTENLKSYIKDVGGIRITVMLKSDAYEVVNQLEKAFAVVEKTDYIAHPKKNGYRSIHLIIHAQVNVDHPRVCPIEIQVRTIGMDVWSTLDHYFNYKKDTDPEAMKSFLAMSESIEKFEDLAEELQQKSI